MTPEQEQKVLASLYDRLFDAVTYVPGGGRTGGFDKSTTLIQFAKNTPLREDDFANALSPMNPTGDARSAGGFSGMVDPVPAVGLEYQPTSEQVSSTYKSIVDGANTDNEVDEHQKKVYDQAFAYLNETTVMKDYTGKEIRQNGPSPIKKAYDANQAAYTRAIGGYRTAYNGYDLSKIEDQRGWNAVQPPLQTNVDQTWNAWRDAGAALVEQAQNALHSTINDAVASAISQAQDMMSPQRQMAPNTATGQPWYLSYALPGDWISRSDGAILNLKSSYLHTTDDASSTSWGGGGSWSAGLWSVGASVSHSSASASHHMQSDDFELTATLGTVRILRPWMNTNLLRMHGWWMKGVDAGGISPGELKDAGACLLPLIPVGFVVARDIEIRCDFATQDQTHVESATSGSARVGWGPFSVSGSYSHSESHDTFTANYEGGVLKIGTPQIIAWISEITPKSPPRSGPAR